MDSDRRPVPVTVVQRTSSDLRLNPHLHLVVLDGAWHEDGGELAWEGLGHLRTSEVGEVLEWSGASRGTFPVRPAPDRWG